MACLKARSGSTDGISPLPGYLCRHNLEFVPEAVSDRGIRKVKNGAYNRLAY